MSLASDILSKCSVYCQITFMMFGLGSALLVGLSIQAEFRG
jgi:hypothetical protein